MPALFEEQHLVLWLGIAIVIYNHWSEMVSAWNIFFFCVDIDGASRYLSLKPWDVIAMKMNVDKNVLKFINRTFSLFISVCQRKLLTFNVYVSVLIFSFYCLTNTNQTPFAKYKFLLFHRKAKKKCVGIIL